MTTDAIDPTWIYRTYSRIAPLEFIGQKQPNLIAGNNELLSSLRFVLEELVVECTTSGFTLTMRAATSSSKGIARVGARLGRGVRKSVLRSVPARVRLLTLPSRWRFVYQTILVHPISGLSLRFSVVGVCVEFLHGL